jgi:hypothetical protein
MKKTILALMLISSCTQKYVSYDLVHKVKFEKKDHSNPITLGKVLAAGKDELSSCFNQWLFFSNAEKEKEKAIPFIIKSLCPGNDYLVETEMTETWWTTIIFTRSCVDVQTLCGQLKK